LEEGKGEFYRVCQFNEQMLTMAVDRWPLAEEKGRRCLGRFCGLTPNLGG
jgi:hypothetical protein